MLKSKSLKLAGIFAYIFIAVNTVSGFLLGPTILSKVGSNIYGVYTTVNSLVSALMIADLGVSQTLIRFVADYKANNRSNDDLSKLCKTVKAINYILTAITIVAGVIVYTAIPRIYRASFSSEEIGSAQALLIIYLISIIATLLSNYYSGIISGYGYFTYINITKTASIFLKLVISIIAVTLYANIYFVVWINAIISVATYFADLVFYKSCIKIKLNCGFARIDVFKAVAIYTGFIFIQTVVDQVNSNLDNVIIGAIVGTTAVTIYSFGLTIFHMFQQLSTSISQMLVPYMSDVVASGADHREVENRLIKIGKIQYLIVGGIYFGFISFGKIFVEIWLRSGYEQVWIVAVILMSGGLLPLIQNGAIALLKAKNRMGFRTVTLFVAAVLNAGLTIIFVYSFGFVYAAVGTAMGFLIINTVIMDIYYYKKLNLNMLRVLWNILYKATVVNIICAIMAFLPQILFFNLSIYVCFIMSVAIFLALYCPIVYHFVLTIEERNMLFGRLFKR